MKSDNRNTFNGLALAVNGKPVFGIPKDIVLNILRLCIGFTANYAL